ncbi:MAG: hypothetical protein ABIO61_01135 [Thermomonas sp.]
MTWRLVLLRQVAAESGVKPAQTLTGIKQCHDGFNFSPGNPIDVALLDLAQRAGRIARGS